MMRTSGLLSATWLLLMVSGAAYGQNALGDGRALDANPGVNQGRTNPTRTNTIEDQIRLNNAIITGNAPGGRSFRGYVGYTGTGDFRGRAGSDTLYSFRRDSAYSGVSGTGVRGSDALRYQFGMTTGANVPSFMASGLQATRASTAATASAALLRSTSEFVAAQTSRPSLVGSRQDEWGAEFVAKASPLLGVTWVKTGESPLATASPSTRTPGGPSTAANFTGQESSVRGVSGVLDRSPQALPTGQQKSPGQASPEQPGSTDANPAGAATRILPENLAVRSQAYTSATESFRTALGSSAPSPSANERAATSAPVAQTYELQMERLRRMMAGKPELTDRERLQQDLDRRQRSGFDQTKVTQDQPSESATKPSQAAAADAPKPGDTLTPEVVGALRSVGTKRVEKLAVQPLDPKDQANDPAAYTHMMTEGEELLGRGRYFDSEERFTRALAAMSRDPMARAGRLNSQLGSAMFLSAATNYRELIKDFPELAAMRFAANLIPKAERLDQISTILRDDLKRNQSGLGRDAALLLAYVGYQRGDEKTMNEGLSEFQQRSLPGADGDEDRALHALLTAAWGK